MSETLRVACVQNCAGPDMADNIERAAAQVREARGQGAELIALPEHFTCLDIGRGGVETGALPTDEHPALPRFADLARETVAWLLLGSVAIREGERQHNRSYLVNDSGEIVTHYDKIHLFDIDLGKGESYRESDKVIPGEQAVVTATPWGKMGLTVCYDLRFAYLYRALAQAGAGILTCPAAFTRTTGRAHWHTLVRARAIETGSFLIAPCQSGKHGERYTYGHSLIVDPWGEILAEGADEAEEVIVADLDLARVAQVRSRLPALQHDRPFVGPESTGQ
ncbi:MAG: carbon-nitrogen hydrolase family protein [Halofilum sp. (in: g-proteobacteria)]